MKPVVSLSTCWLSHRHTDGYAMLVEMAGLGFESVELSHGIRISLVPGILKALEDGVVRVASLHNFCPLPTGYSTAAPNIYLPSAPDPRERSQWLRHSRRTIDFARQVGARAVVLHLGAVGFFWFDPVRRFRRFLQGKGAGLRAGDAAYDAQLARTMAAVRKRADRHLDRVQACLEELLPYAEEHGVRLGFENRERIEELPLDDGFTDLLAALGDPPQAGYWHDAGHAQLKQLLGLVDHREQLAKYAASLVGFHLHDVDPATGKDHQALGTGIIDFSMIARFFQPHHLLTLELGPKVSAEGVAESRDRLHQLLSAL